MRKSSFSTVFLVGLAVAFLISGPTVFASPISWWKFDEGSGSTAYDSAGSHNGTVNGATWTTGQIGSALEFDGVGNYVNCGYSFPSVTGSTTKTIMAWAKADITDYPDDEGSVFTLYKAYSTRCFAIVAEGNPATWQFIYMRIPDAPSGFNSGIDVIAGQWMHLALVQNGANVSCYINGVPRSSVSDGIAPAASYPDNARIGGGYSGYNFFDGKIDDVRIYDRALSAGEIWQIYGEGFGGRAFNPNPADGATAVVTDKILSWSPGSDSASHDVYLGTSYNNVNNANKSSTEYVGSFDVNSFDPCGLECGTTYCWRVDEINDTNLRKGDVWSFTTLRGKDYIAFAPNPADEATGVNPDTVLSWSSIHGVASHDVYLGTSYNNVNVANTSSLEYKGNYDVNTFDPCDFDFMTTYYWRVDEINPCGITKGGVWSFTTGVGTISWWKFDEGAGTTAYDSVGSNHGTIYGATWITDQVIGALSFDGVDDYIGFGYSSSLKPPLPITLSAWIMLSSLGKTQFIMVLDTQRYNYYGVWFYVNAANHLGIGYGDGGLNLTSAHRRNKDGTTTLSTDTWYHVAAVIRGPTDMDLYINGESDEGSYSGTGGSLHYCDCSLSALIGNSHGSTGPFDGKIDDVRLYDIALHAEEIQELHQQGTGKLAWLEMVGPDEIFKYSSAQYRAIAHYDNNTTKDVTDLAQWSLEPNTLATIDDSGLLLPSDVNTPCDVVVYAQFTDDGITLQQNITAQIYSLSELKIIGPEEVWEISSVQYEAVVYYDNGDTNNVTDLVQWRVEPSAIASIDANGLLTVNNLDTSQDIIIYAQYTESGAVFETEMPVHISALSPVFYVPGDYPTIQQAIDAVGDGDTIIVAPGTYTGSGNRDIDFLGKAIAVRSVNPNDPNIVAATIIDCNGTKTEPHRGFYFRNSEDANSVLAGFTITNAYGLSAIYCSNSSPTITNCTITGNTGRSAGGIFCYGSSSPMITNCIISGNTANIGSGIYCDNSSPTITNCTITGNSAMRDGGGIYCYSTSIPKVANCTIVGNSAKGLGGGICLADSSLSVSVTSSIIWGNSDSSGAGQSAQVYSGKPSVWFSCIQDDNPDDINVPFGADNYNIDDDPCFVDPGYWDANGLWFDGDYHLLAASPCIETGNPYFTYHQGDVDMDGQPRLMGRCVDMGADEFEIAMIVVTKPKGSEVWTGGSIHEIKWDSYGINGTVDIYYSTNNGANWIKIANTPDTGSFIWHLPRTQFSWFCHRLPLDSNQCLVSVKPHIPVPNLISIESGLFTIQPYLNWPVVPWWPGCPHKKFGPKYGCVKWKFQTGGPVTAGVAIGYNNRVHVPCEDGKLYTLNAGGKLLWTYDTNSPLVSSPAVDRNGNVYVGAENGKLYAIDRNGRLLWTHTTNGPIYSSPVVSLDNQLCGYTCPYWKTPSPPWHCGPWEQPVEIFVCSVDGTLYALAQDGSELWSFETDSVSAVTTGAIFASPAIDHNDVLHIAGIYDPNLYALDSNNISVKWNRNFSNLVNPSGKRPWPFASPVIAEDGTIYQTLLYDPNLYAIDPNDGSIIWSTSLAGLVLQYGRNPDEYIIWYGVGDPPEYIEVNGRQYRVREVYPYLYASCWSKPALAPDGTIYVSFDDPYLRAVDPNGTIKWMTKLGAVGGFALTVGRDGLIYAACDDARLYVVDPNGQQVAQFEGFGGLSFPTITVGRTIIVSDANNTVWAIGQNDCQDLVLALHQLEDLNGDGAVNNTDFAILTADWLNCTDTDPPCDYQGDEIYPKGDINKDLYVDFADLTQLVNRWLTEE